MDRKSLEEQRLVDMAVSANQYQYMAHEIFDMHFDQTVPILIMMCGNVMMSMQTHQGYPLTDNMRVSPEETADLFRLAEDVVARGPSSAMIFLYALGASMGNQIKETQLAQQADNAVTEPS